MEQKPTMYLENKKGKNKILKWKSNLRVNKNNIKLIAFFILIIILIIVICINIYNMNKNYKIYKSYEKQLISLQEKERQRQIEKEKARQAKLPKLTEAGKQNIEHIYSSDSKRVFLTFDDGPSTVTPTILDTLKNENVKASFFVLGSNVERYPNTLKRIYDENHYIANHGYSHVYTSIYASPQAVLDEFNRCNDAVKNALGEPEYNSHLFRFPGGLAGGKYAEVKQQAKQLLLQNNIVHVDWNALNGDAETNDLSVDFELQRLRETVCNKNSVVILMHDAQAKKVTAEALPQIIKYLKEQGYEFKTFYDLMK